MATKKAKPKRHYIKNPHVKNIHLTIPVDIYPVAREKLLSMGLTWESLFREAINKLLRK